MGAGGKQHKDRSTSSPAALVAILQSQRTDSNHPLLIPQTHRLDLLAKELYRFAIQAVRYIACQQGTVCRYFLTQQRHDAPSSHWNLLDGWPGRKVFNPFYCSILFNLFTLYQWEHFIKVSDTFLNVRTQSRLISFSKCVYSERV
jgi:hypothetical protein